MLFKEIIAVYSENHVKPINTKCSITDCQKQMVHIVTARSKRLKNVIKQNLNVLMIGLCNNFRAMKNFRQK
jgi:hypothetical protein